MLALRSSRIIWQEGKGKGKPWNINKLTLHCSVDTLLLTAKGTDLIRQKKAQAFLKTLKKLEQQDNLNSKQQALVKKTQIFYGSGRI